MSYWIRSRKKFFSSNFHNSRGKQLCFNLLRYNDARWTFFLPNCNIFSISSILGILTQAKQIISSLLLDHFYPVISKEKESDELLCTAWSLVMVRKPVASARRLRRKVSTLIIFFFSKILKIRTRENIESSFSSTRSTIVLKIEIFS